MSIFTKVMVRTGLVERRQDGRTPASDLEVLCGPEAEQKPLEIRDISPTGIFLLTSDPLPPGSTAVLTLERKNASSSGSQVRLRARAVRSDAQGVGLTFDAADSPAGTWLDLMIKAAPLAASNDPVARFRAAKALSFLARIAASAQQELVELLGRGLDGQRRDRAIAMLLSAEELLEQWNRPLRQKISANLLRELLLSGSSAEEELERSLWLHLLATSCLISNREDESLRLAGILSDLTQMDLALFAAACDKTIATGALAKDVQCTAEEVCEMVHSTNLRAIEHHLHHLNDQGLLGRTMKPLKGEQIKSANLTVTPLGLELYTRCWLTAQPQSALACG